MRAICAGLLLLVFGVSGAMADVPDSLNLPAFAEVVEFDSIANSAWVVGGGGLLVALTVGGGFIIARKVFAWVMQGVTGSPWGTWESRAGAGVKKVKGRGHRNRERWFKGFMAEERAQDAWHKAPRSSRRW